MTSSSQGVLIVLSSHMMSVASTKDVSGNAFLMASHSFIVKPSHHMNGPNSMPIVFPGRSSFLMSSQIKATGSGAVSVGACVSPR